MAGDWIKMRCDLADDLEVIRIAAELGITEDEVVGKLFRTWVWIQSVSRDGHAPSVTESWLDRRIGRDGWSRAMVAAGWLVVHPTGIEFPNFDRHMSEGAKRRALAHKRQEKHRSGVTQMSRPERDKNVTREEKRREEIEETPPSGGCGGDAGSSDRLTVIPNSQAPRWSRAEGLFLPASAIASLRKAFPDADLEAMLAGWDAWRQGEDGLRARNPMGSIESWIRNRSGAVAAGEVVPVLSDEEELAIIRAADA